MAKTKAPLYPRSFRLVCEHGLVHHVEALLEAEGYVFENEPFSPWCRRLLEEPRPLGSSLAAFFGYIYIQDRSSMLPPLALSPPPGGAVLDMCASPGSKTGFLAQIVGREGFVLANEPNASRIGTLKANMRAANLFQVGSSRYAGERLPLPDGSWSHILLDPPCSGWGTEARNPSVRKIWHGDKLRGLLVLQRNLLTRAAALLKPGGRLLYSTCTTNPWENEIQASFAQDELGLEPVPIEPFPGFQFERPTPASLLVSGNESQAQGFFLSLFRKQGIGDGEAPQTATNAPRQPNHQPANQHPPMQGISPVWDLSLLPPGDVAIFGDKARFIPRAATASLPSDFTWQGALLGMAKSGIRLSPRLRSLIRRPSGTLPLLHRVIMDDVNDIKAMLAGKSVMAAGYGPGCGTLEASLWWRDLPLAVVAIKSGRIIASLK